MAKSMPSIVLTGYYGMNNFGDDLFAFIGNSAAKEFWSKYEVKVLAPTHLDFDAKFLVPNVASTAYSSHKPSGQIIRLATGITSALMNEKIVYCGGSLFAGSPSGVRRFSEYFAKKRLSAVGVSLGPFSSVKDEKAVCNSLRHFEFIAVRDRRSYEFLKSIDVEGQIEFAADIAGLSGKYLRLTPKDLKTEIHSDLERPGKLSLGFSPCNYDPKSEEPLGYCNSFVNAVIAIKKEVDVQVSVLLLNRHPVVGDSNLCAKTIAMLRENGIDANLFDYQKNGIAETISKISSFDMFVSARLHGAIVAYICGVPFSVHAHHSKIIDFAQDINLDAELISQDSESVKKALFLLLKQKKLKCFFGLKEFTRKAELNFSRAPWTN